MSHEEIEKKYKGKYEKYISEIYRNNSEENLEIFDKRVVK